jgi:NAD(P) transhydrogenase subunit alpha
MKISTITCENDNRVAVTPETARKYIALGFEVVLPKNAGLSAGFRDDEYVAAGAKIQETGHVRDADIYVCVKPSFSEAFTDEHFSTKSQSHLIGLLSPFQNESLLKKMFADGVHLYALEKIPRITRAQSMDVLSSQASIVGYKAVLVAISKYNRVVPLMMTAAGTIRPTKFLILGAGVVGLQAIATAKRLGGIVAAYDVRAVAKEQVESLGATFITIDGGKDSETSGGYAKEMDENYKARQHEKLAQAISKVDIVISTAQIPEKPAPRLITKDMVESMQAGSVIVDLATESGGNCELSERDKTIKHGNVTILGLNDFASRVACDSSQLFARNVCNFVSLMLKDGKIDASDEIIAATNLIF